MYHSDAVLKHVNAAVVTIKTKRTDVVVNWSQMGSNFVFDARRRPGKSFAVPQLIRRRRGLCGKSVRWLRICPPSSDLQHYCGSVASDVLFSRWAWCRFGLATFITLSMARNRSWRTAVKLSGEAQRCAVELVAHGLQVQF